jgi:DNA segregation ATPase FtsK/SpoIIIE-like protein
VNIHVIISTQRADARTTIPPQIKCCLSARICFTTTDKNNSIVILDQEGAEDLGKIEGRAILLDSEMNIVQVPFMDDVKCDEILEPYRKEMKDDEYNQSEERRTNSKLTDKISDLFKESVGGNGIQGEHQSYKCMQQNDAENVSGWFRLESGKRER